MNKEIVYSKKAPAAIGPYTQGVKAGDLLFISGQLPIDPGTGELLTGDIQTQTKQVMENLKAIIEEAGATLEDVVKTTIFLKDMNQFSLVNEAYGEYFKDNPPARACIEIARLPKDAQIEIEAVVLVKN
ncbi:MAG: RidA family protein [Clostridia bacterium]|nr:RidA family protein [Clostridia bacterium]